jgi:diguanylate cyclase (GGDEF)-like protein
VALDIDHFKAYNDDFGHAAGDEVLRAVARILRAGTRSVDLLVRTGGEEFVIVLPGTGLEEAMLIADRLRTAIENHSWPARRVTASFGVTETIASTDASQLRHFLDLADHALYHSKRAGRNRVTHARSLDADSARWPHSIRMTAS